MVQPADGAPPHPNLPTRRVGTSGLGEVRSVRRNMNGQAIDRIRSLIFNGTLARGQRVPQNEIADELQVSRLPVREALIALESEGLIESEPHRGAFVVPIYREDIEDHYRVYGMVQGLATRRAAIRVTPPTLERLADLHQQMQDTEAHSDLAHSLNWEFHALINQTGGSRRLLSILRQMARNLPREVYQAPPAASPEAIRGHQQILDALRAGDGEAGDAASRRHVQAEGEYVIAKLRADGVLADDGY
ncbi:GntR family transcriptional regulator [Mycolicibacterium sp.]|uniref:GntR family transcriptional regulator n=1 Tax=Mycolicibacterium sp. TaxID=2320850 RepID=UPI003D0C4E59